MVEQKLRQNGANCPSTTSISDFCNDYLPIYKALIKTSRIFHIYPLSAALRYLIFKSNFHKYLINNLEI